MPVMDGFEATEKIRQLETQLGIARTPIIALTASVVDDDIQKCFDSGMDDYVPKPFKAEILKEKIVSAIEMKQQELSDTVQEQTPAIQEIVVPKETVVEASGDSNKPSPVASNGSRILLVEDNLVNQKVASLHLAKAGFEYDIAGNGQEALELYQSNVNYDVILMDCMMPVKDGLKRLKIFESMKNSRV
ncbi:CheY-like receiver [Vibrio variabilis]|uniref:CheY-like receiver n=1 Tax=Vibrio variabilis TaxID=990271 RepID=A0ABQ0JJW8_9VIBR|nr:CheY-like receiver [Vibrio variabilis]